jgi:hypothetical protein
MRRKGTREGTKETGTFYMATSETDRLTYCDCRRDIERTAKPGIRVGNYGGVRDSDYHSRQCGELCGCDDREIRLSAVTPLTATCMTR